MTIKRRIGFALLTVLLVAGVTEGIARIIWWRLEVRAFSVVESKGVEQIRNDTVNFAKQADGQCGYVLRPGYHIEDVLNGRPRIFHVNEDGFAQRENVSLERAPGVLRVVTLGESTTQGHDVDHGSYPTCLRRLMGSRVRGGVEVINAGVAGWVSDQLAAWTEKKVGAYAADVAVLYVGWNDFQSYSPYHVVPPVSVFEQNYGHEVNQRAASWFKSVALLTALYQRKRTEAALAAAQVPAQGAAPEELYKFFLASLDRIIAALRAGNPNIRIAMCTLVCRWPQGTQEQFDAPNGHVWWMEKAKIGPARAAEDFARFNDVIRKYAADHGLTLIDVAPEFEGLDRGRLQLDFAHFGEEGYELLAEVIYHGLVRSGLVQGDAGTRREELMAKYRLSSPAARN